MNIVINADDFGINEVQSLCICESFKRGLITQTTTMVNMPWFEKGVECSKVNGFYDKVGLHFNLTEGAPLSDEMKGCAWFCNPSGEFTGDFHRSIKTRLLLPTRYKKALVAECIAQIERYLDAGYRMMHLDSHHHVHTDLSIATTLLPIAKRYGFKTVRMSRTISAKPMGLTKSLYKAVYNSYARRQIPFAVDEFTDLRDFMLSHCSIRFSKGVEIMVHPGLEIVQPGVENDPPIEEQEKFWRCYYNDRN